MARKKGKVTPFRQETKITYNKYKPNRKARRLGIKPEEPPKREEKKVSKAAVLRESVQRARGNTKADCTAGYDLWGIHGISERQTAAVGREKTGGT